MSQERELAHSTSYADAPTRDDDLAPGRSSLSAKLDAPAHPMISGLIQRKAERDANGVADGVDHAIASASTSSGMALPAPIQRKFESSLGTDLSSVRLHIGGASASAAHAVGAKAYTMGQDVHFGAGQYDPNSASGQHLLAHEVAHTVQQRGGTPTRQNKLEVSAPQDAAEHEADHAADAMVSGGVASIGGFSGMQRKVFRDAAPVATATPQVNLPPPSVGGGIQNPAVANGNNQVANAGGAQSPTGTGTADSSQFLRPTPTPLDPSVASSIANITMGQQAFGKSQNWKKDIDWTGFSAWVNKVPQVEANIANTVNPKIGSDLAVVQHIHDDYQQRLGDAFAKEQSQIEQIVKNDTTVMSYVTHINTQSGLISTEFGLKSAALDDISAATDNMVAAVSEAEASKTDDEKQKEQKYLDDVKTQKAAALSQLEQIPELIVGAAKVVGGVVTKGPEALAEPGQKLAESMIMGAYKAWADKDVEAKYETTINNIQFKIRNLEARIQNLKTVEFAAKVSAASSNAKAAATRLQVSTTRIQVLANDINQTRVQLGTYVSQKYKQVSCFRLASEATNSMKPVLTKYLGDLSAAKAQLKQLDPWQQYYSQLLNAGSKVVGANWMNGGPLPQPGEVKQLTQQQEQEVAEIDHYAFEVGRVGQYVESENAHYDAEIEKVQSGGYLDFVQQFDQKLVAMLPTAVPK